MGDLLRRWNWLELSSPTIFRGAGWPISTPGSNNFFPYQLFIKIELDYPMGYIRDGVVTRTWVLRSHGR